MIWISNFLYSSLIFSQGDVLNRAVEVVNRMETESPGPSTNPNRKGFFDGFAAVEQMTFAFIRNLGISSEVCQEFVQKARTCFDQERASLLLAGSAGVQLSPSGTAKRDEHDMMASTSSSPSTSEAGGSVDRKEVKKNREQDRRDRQGEAFEALKHFIIANKLMTSHQVYVTNICSLFQCMFSREKMQRLNTLEIIINYIRNKKNNFVSRTGPEQTLYTHAVAEGQKTAKSIAIGFFKGNRHLMVHCVNLEKFFEMNINPKPLLGFPRLPPVSPPVLPSAPPFPMVPIYPFRAFPFFPLMTPPQTASRSTQQSPAYSLESPPPSSDTSSSSLESSSTPNENSTDRKPSKVFRPWE